MVKTLNLWGLLMLPHYPTQLQSFVHGKNFGRFTFFLYINGWAWLGSTSKDECTTSKVYQNLRHKSPLC